MRNRKFNWCGLIEQNVPAISTSSTPVECLVSAAGMVLWSQQCRLTVNRDVLLLLVL